MPIKQLSDGDADGVCLGQSRTDKVGFFGTAPVVQRSGASQAAVAVTGATNTTPFGYTTAAQADAIVTLLNEIRQVLVTNGMMRGSA